MLAAQGPRGRALVSFGQSDGPVWRHVRRFDPRSSSPPLQGGALDHDHVGCHATRSMRAMICASRRWVNYFRSTARMKYRACRMRRPPVLNRRCCKLVSDQLWMATTGKTSLRSRAACPRGTRTVPIPSSVGRTCRSPAGSSSLPKKCTKSVSPPANRGIESSPTRPGKARRSRAKADLHGGIPRGGPCQAAPRWPSPPRAVSPRVGVALAAPSIGRGSKTALRVEGAGAFLATVCYIIDTSYSHRIVSRLSFVAQGHT